MSAAFEAEHVHAVYDEIASDFSRTRHSRWPFVQLFLDSLEPPGALVLDAGTGNGKYLGCRSILEWQGKRDLPLPAVAARSRKGKAKAASQDPPVDPARTDLMPIGFDMSNGLLTIANQRGHEVVRGDCVDLSCWRRGAFDHAISIATIHHFATPERRCEAVKQMILAVLPPDPPSSLPSTSSHARPPSRLLIVVWSLEQDPNLVTDDRSARRKTNGKKGAVPVQVPAAVGSNGGDGVESGTTTNMATLSVQDASAPDRDDPAVDDEEEEEEEEEPAQDVFVPWARQNQVSKAEKAAAAAAAAAAAESARTHAATSTAPNDPQSRSDDSDPRTTNGGTPIRNDPTPTPASTSATSTATVVPPPTTLIEPEPAPTFNRYYHLFRHYELSNLVRSAAAQLGLAFSAPDDYPLEAADLIASSSTEGRKAVNEREGWEAKVRLCEERWERENWVVEVQVGWERTPQ